MKLKPILNEIEAYKNTVWIKAHTHVTTDMWISMLYTMTEPLHDILYDGLVNVSKQTWRLNDV